MKQKLPKGWTEEEILELAEYYDNQTEDEAIAEAEAAYSDPAYAWVQIPHALLPRVRALLIEYDEATESKERRKAGRKK
jgi:hypothetical protein